MIIKLDLNKKGRDKKQVCQIHLVMQVTDIQAKQMYNLTVIIFQILLLKIEIILIFKTTLNYLYRVPSKT